MTLKRILAGHQEHGGVLWEELRHDLTADAAGREYVSDLEALAAADRYRLEDTFALADRFEYRRPSGSSEFL